MSICTAKFKDFDTSGGGAIDREGLHRLLIELNAGEAISQAELDWVLRRADKDKSGLIELPELRIAVAMWYTHVNFVKPYKERQPTGWGTPRKQMRNRESCSCCSRNSSVVRRVGVQSRSS